MTEQGEAVVSSTVSFDNDYYYITLSNFLFPFQNLSRSSNLTLQHRTELRLLAKDSSLTLEVGPMDGE